MYKVLIIDDSWEKAQKRSEVYSEVLASKFLLSHIQSGSNIRQNIDESDNDIILLDIVLSGMLNPSTGLQLNIFDMLTMIGTSKPIILVSNEYKTLLDQGHLTKIMNYIIDKGYVNIKGFLLWAEFEKAVISHNESEKITITHRIELEIQRHKKELEKIENINFDFAVIAALEMELVPFILRVKQSGKINKEFQSEYHKFYIGEFNSKSGRTIKFIASHQCRMGLTDCAYLTTHILNTYKVTNIFMVGVCGGRPTEGVKIGDVIIPHETIAYQDGKLDANKFIPDAGVAAATAPLFNVVPLRYLEETARKIHNIFHDDYKDTHNGVGLDIPFPNVWREEMASGDQIINRPLELDLIAEKVGQRKLCSVDMESYALMRAVFLDGQAKGAVIKCVMDVTEEKKDHYKTYAAYLAANLLFEILFAEQYQL